MICYKVTSPSGRSLYYIPHNGAVQYEIGKKAMAKPYFANKGYHLLAFESVACVFTFFYGMNCTEYGNRVFECWGGYQVPKLPSKMDMSVFTNPISAAWPDGTLMFECITPLRELTGDELQSRRHDRT